MRSECYFCHIKTVEKLVHKFKPNIEVADNFIFYFHELMARNMDLKNPKLATEVHRLASEKLGVKELYSHEKQWANDLLSEKYDYWQEQVSKSEDSFVTAAKLAVVGNIIDYGAHSLNGELSEQIHSLLKKPLKVNKVSELKEAIMSAKSILYLGDNAGEIVFDKLFIETMNHPNVTFVTRGKPVINDVTINDAQHVGMDKVCNVISNGYDAPSTLLENCSREFRKAYREADLIISKGQGNFEGLMDNDHQNTFFMLIAKCKPMSELLGVGEMDMVVTKFNKKNNGV